MERAAYVFINRHEPEQCQQIFEEAVEHPWPASLKDIDVPCTCPSNDHTAYFAVGVEDPAALLESLPPLFRSGTTFKQGVVATVGTSIPVAAG